MAQSRASTVQERRDEVYEAFQYAASFHCPAEEWHGCEELKPEPNEKWREKWKRKNIEWCGAQLEAKSVAQGGEGAVKR